MTTACVADFVDALRQSNILQAAQLKELEGSLQAGCGDTPSLIEELERRQWLTPFQTNLLLRGRGRHLVLGQYVLLERLGEGTMGQVFKARHRLLERIVAIKLLRREQLTSPGAVRRFHREISAVAQLAHANIVLAYDADQYGSMNFLVMEFVAGIDLGRMLRQKRRFAIAQACEYVRQAAAGLQHAHERGLVHRDIKPSNILIAGGQARAGKKSGGGRTEGKSALVGLYPWGMVKILDLGLARLHRFLDEETSSTMTLKGTVMGTPDYIAPEQILNSHTVDIRADLYSLGCTFYHLLTGEVPFPGGTVTDKLLRHQASKPWPVESLRPDVPDRVAAIVRRLMATDPGERWQTPGELAAALGSLRSLDETVPPPAAGSR